MTESVIAVIEKVVIKSRGLGGSIAITYGRLGSMYFDCSEVIMRFWMKGAGSEDTGSC